MNHEVRELLDHEWIERRAEGERFQAGRGDIRGHLVHVDGRNGRVLRAADEPTCGSEDNDDETCQPTM
jgi:hypothetical protein